MTDIMHRSGKKDKQFLFDVQLNWLNDNKGILTTNDVKDTLRVALPQVFDGEGEQWSPEHLFLSSLSSCFMTTYLVFAKKMQFEISHFDCNIIGQVELVDGHYEFTTVNIYPKVYIAVEAYRQKAIAALEKTQKYCLVSQSVKSRIIYHGEILNEEHIGHQHALENAVISKT